MQLSKHLEQAMMWTLHLLSFNIEKNEKLFLRFTFPECIFCLPCVCCFPSVAPFFQAEKAEQRAKNLEEAKQIVIEEDASLDKAKKVKWLTVKFQDQIIIYWNIRLYSTVIFGAKSSWWRVLLRYSCQVPGF